MTRSQRLLALIHLFRSHRFPVSGARLARELGVSLRTIYRDIDTLRDQGAVIEGEAGLGYVLRPGFLLPPLMFTEEEIEAIVLGTRWVASNADDELGKGGESALAKIASVLPGSLREAVDSTTLLIGPSHHGVRSSENMAQIRLAIREERKLAIRYTDLKDVQSDRTVWPFALGYFDDVQLLVAWCELREGFRNFRTDRILALEVQPVSYPRGRRSLLKQWRDLEGIPER